MIWLWWQWQGNYIWIVNHIFVWVECYREQYLANNPILQPRLFEFSSWCYFYAVKRVW